MNRKEEIDSKLFIIREKVLEECEKDLDIVNNLHNSDTFVKDVCYLVPRVVLLWSLLFATRVVLCIVWIVKSFKGNKKWF